MQRHSHGRTRRSSFAHVHSSFKLYALIVASCLAVAAFMQVAASMSANAGQYAQQAVQLAVDKRVGGATIDTQRLRR